MRSISKAVIAMMIAAAMCVVPLFVIEDSEAASLKVEGNGASFEADSISDADFNKLISDELKEIWANKVLEQLGTNLRGGNILFPVDTYDIGPITITDVKNVKMSVGKNVTDGSTETVDATALEFNIKFKATRINEEGPLFNSLDGIQDLYKILDYGGTIPVDATLEFDGKVTIADSEKITTKITKNAQNNYVPTEKIRENSDDFEYTGALKYTYTYNTKDVVQDMEITVANSRSGKSTTTYDFGDVAVDKVVDDTKVISTDSISKGAQKYSFKYKLGDTSGEAGYAVDINDDYGVYIQMMLTQIVSILGGVGDGEVRVLTGADIILTGAIDAGTHYFYSDTASESETLFTPDMVKSTSTDIRNDSGMKDFLDKAGETSTEYSKADSINDSAYTSVSVGGSGSNNIVFYVIIGVLAVAVVALAVLMIKKK